MCQGCRKADGSPKTVPVFCINFQTCNQDRVDRSLGIHQWTVSDNFGLKSDTGKNGIIVMGDRSKEQSLAQAVYEEFFC